MTGPIIYFLILLISALILIAWAVWRSEIMVWSIPKAKIIKAAQDLRTKFGNRAAEMAASEEFHYWRKSDFYEQGRWRRIRRVLESAQGTDLGRPT